VSSSTDSVPRPSVLLADDHTPTAEQLRKLLQRHFDVVALVEDGRALVSAVARLSPDVIVADISMPALDGIDAAALILRSNPAARIVLITVHDEPILVNRALAAGALGYVLKDAAGDELVPAVHAALGGRRYVSRALRQPERDFNPDVGGHR
jgi:DNA-binding NarL/FixJ family response regulator